MSSAKTIAKNTGFLLTAEIVDKLLRFFLIVVITRYLGDIGFGIYSFAFAFISMFSILANLGLNTFMVREIARDKSKTEKFVNNIITLKLSIVTIVFSLSFIIALLWDKSAQITPIIFLVIIHEIIETLILTIRVMFNAHEKMHYTLFVTVIERTIALLAGLVALYRGYGLMGLITALIISKLITLLSSYIISRKKFIKIKLSFDFEFWKYAVKRALPFWFTLLFFRIYTKTDTIMLSAMKGFAETGWYNAASKLIEALSFFPDVIINAVFPSMSRFHETSKDLLQVLFRKTFYYMFVLSFPLTVGVTILANRFIIFIYKNEFVLSGSILQILIWAVLFMFVNQSMGYLLNAINKQKCFTISNGVCAFANIILNLALIPKYSYIGAAIATVSTQIISFSLLYYFTSANGYKINLIKTTYKPIIAGIIMGVSILYLNFLHILLIVPIAMILYFLALILIGGFGKEEFDLVRSLIKREKT